MRCRGDRRTDGWADRPTNRQTDRHGPTLQSWFAALLTWDALSSGIILVDRKNPRSFSIMSTYKKTCPKHENCSHIHFTLMVLYFMVYVLSLVLWFLFYSNCFMVIVLFILFYERILCFQSYFLWYLELLASGPFSHLRTHFHNTLVMSDWLLYVISLVKMVPDRHNATLS